MVIMVIHELVIHLVVFPTGQKHSPNCFPFWRGHEEMQKSLR